MRHDARIIWGARIIPDFAGYVRVLLIVTGLEGNSAVLPGFRGNIEVFEDVDWGSLQLYRLDAPSELEQTSGTASVETILRTEQISLTTPTLAESDGHQEKVLISQSTDSEISSLATSIIANEPLQGLGLKKIESASSAN